MDVTEIVTEGLAIAAEYIKNVLGGMSKDDAAAQIRANRQKIVENFAGYKGLVANNDPDNV